MVYKKKDCVRQRTCGFRKDMGCTDQIFVLTSLISLYLDRVGHGLIWTKMHSMNINGRVLEVMRNLNQKTKACGNVNAELSDVFNCRMGVRQGDTLLPLLFLIYINDFN